jgi:hypothetical protein
MKRIVNFICIASLALTACNDLDQYPMNRFTDVNYWTSEEKVSAVLNQAYNQMYNAAAMFDMERLTDNIYFAKGTDPNTVVLGAADAYNGLFFNHWRDCYQGIKTCNIFLDNVDPIAFDPGRKERMKAEARFIRAFLFFRLATCFGDVPHFDDQIPLEEAQMISRKPRAEVIAWVRNELNSIAGLLPAGQHYAAADRGRITRGAAAGLLARTWLYDNDWENTASVCKSIIDGAYGAYDLFDGPYLDVFMPENEYNTEVMLDLTYIPEIRTWDNMRDNIPSTAGSRSSEFAPTQELVDDYVMLNGLPISDPASGYNPDEPYAKRDPRFDAIVYDGYQWERPDGSVYTIHIKPGEGPVTNDMYVPGSLISSQTGYYIRKWYDPQARQEDMASGLNIILLRYADVLLMYAEAMNEQNRMNEDVWNATIRRLRERAGFTHPGALDWKAMSQAELRTLIRRERRCELAFEGTRIFDLRRWKTAEIVLNGTPTGARYQNNNTDPIVLTVRQFNPARDYLWAIPGSERDINPNLGQNPNW